MSELLARLIDVSYEVFGVFVPGVIATVFLGLWWAAAGPLAPVWTFGWLPELTGPLVLDVFQSLARSNGLAIGAAALALLYLVGHLVLWTARSGGPDDKSQRNGWRRVGLTLIFRAPKPSANYHQDLEPLYAAVAARLGLRGKALKWRQFYPVARCLLAQRLSRSLLTTYQNKYTLHRSVATAAAALFWLCLFTAAGALPTLVAGGLQPHWPLLGLLLIGAVAFAAVFSESYMYHWGLFGDTVVTETYSVLFEPRKNAPKR